MVIGDPSKVIGISGVYILGCRHSIFFADGSHSEKPAPLALFDCTNTLTILSLPSVRPPESNFIRPLVLLPFSGGWAGGPWMAPAMHAAVEYAQSANLMPGFVLKLTIKDSKCDAGESCVLVYGAPALCMQWHVALCVVLGWCALESECVHCDALEM